MLYPSDEFGAQELPSAQIPAFVTKQGLPIDGDGCTLMAKVKVNGPNADEVWKFCKAAFPGEVQWNFAAWFLIDQHGQVAGRFSSRDLARLDGELARLAAKL